VTKLVQFLLFLAALGALAYPVAFGLDRTWGRDVVLMKSTTPDHATLDMNRYELRHSPMQPRGEDLRRAVVAIYGEPVHEDLAPSRVLVFEHQRLTFPEEDPDIVLHPTSAVAGESDPVATAPLLEHGHKVTLGSLIAIVVLMLIRRAQVKHARRNLTY